MTPVKDGTRVIIPTYSETENIRMVLDGIWASYAEANVVVVDDGLPDRSWTYLRDRMAADTRHVRFPMERERSRCRRSQRLKVEPVARAVTFDSMIL